MNESGVLIDLSSSRIGEPLLEEVVGIRLLLINVLRPLANGQQMPPEAFDKLVEHIGARRVEIVQQMTSTQRR